MFSATDNFNRADVSPVGGNWVTCGSSNDAKIVSNQLASTTTSSYVYYNATTADDQYSECVVPVSIGGPAIRLTTTNRDGYYYHVSNAALYSRVSDSPSNILSTGDTPSSTAVYKLEAFGSTLTVYKDGVSIGSVTNTDFSSGKTGIYIALADGRVDNWAGGDSVVSTVVTADNSTQANSSNNNAISQTNVVTAASSTQANTSSSGAIVQTMLGMMTADNSVQVNQSTSGGVTQTQSVSANRVVNILEYDTFDRVDSNPAGGNWVTCVGSNDVKIVDGKLASVATISQAYYNYPAPDDQYSECKQSVAYAGPAVRLQGTSRDGYFYHIYNKIIYRVLSGTFSVLATLTDTPNDTSIYRLEVNGTTLSVRKDGISIGSVTDSTFTSGYVGIYVGLAAGRADNWAGTITVDTNAYYQVNYGTSGAITMSHALGADDSVQSNLSATGEISIFKITANNSTQVNLSSTGTIGQVQVMAAVNSVQANQSSSSRMLLTPGYWYGQAFLPDAWVDQPNGSTIWTPSPPTTSIWS